jgi:agmatinase
MTERMEPLDDGQQGGRMTAPRLVLAPSVCVEQLDDAAATIYLHSSGARLRIPRPLYDLLLRFECPAPLEALAVLGPRGERAIPAIERLRAKGFLIREGEAEPTAAQRLTTDPPVRLFDCPAHRLVPAEADVIALGVPYDLADAGAAGARRGPLAIRETSLQLLYALDRRTGQPLGWFDADRGRAILRGVSIADCGDVFVDPGEPQAQVFGRVSRALGQVLARDSLPVVLGGDASVGFPAVECLQAREPLAVIRIGHVSGSGAAPASGFVTPASFARHALALPGVTGYVQLGEDAGANATAGPGGEFVRLSVQAVASAGIAPLAAQLPPGQPVYLGIDIGIVDTMGDDCHHGPGAARLDYLQMHALVCAIGAAYPIRGLDVIGLNPMRSDWPVAAMTALHVLVTAISAAVDHG